MKVMKRKPGQPAGPSPQGKGTREHPWCRRDGPAQEQGGPAVWMPPNSVRGAETHSQGLDAVGRHWGQDPNSHLRHSKQLPPKNTKGKSDLEPMSAIEAPSRGPTVWPHREMAKPRHSWRGLHHRRTLRQHSGYQRP